MSFNGKDEDEESDIILLAYPKPYVI